MPFRDLFKCKVCKKTFSTSENRRQHVSQFHSDKPKKKVTSNPTPNKSEPKSGEKTWPCEVCGETFINSQKRASHNYAVHLKIDWPCMVCGQTFKTYQARDCHRREHPAYSIQSWLCPICDQKFTSRSKLYEHKKKFHPGQGSQNNTCHCKLCGLWCENFSRAKQHFNTDHQGKQLAIEFGVGRRMRGPLRECKKCHVSFSSLQHKRNHMKLRHFRVSFKGKTQRSDIEHRRSVSKDRSRLSLNSPKQKIDENVDGNYDGESPKSSSDESISESHSNSSTPLVLTKRVEVDSAEENKKVDRDIFKCDLCSFSTPHLPSFRSHLTDQHCKEFKDLRTCAICSLRTTSYKRMRRHLKMDHPEHFYAVLNKDARPKIDETSGLDNPCGMCGKRFKFKSLLYIHMRDAHKEEILPSDSKKSCGKCGKRFKFTRLLAHHMRDAHEEEEEQEANQESSSDELRPLPLISPPPRAAAPAKSAEELVITTDMGRKQRFKCDECRKKFQGFESAVRHAKMAHLNLAVRCDACDFEGIEEDMEAHRLVCQAEENEEEEEEFFPGTADETASRSSSGNFEPKVEDATTTTATTSAMTSTRDSEEKSSDDIVLSSDDEDDVPNKNNNFIINNNNNKNSSAPFAEPKPVVIVKQENPISSSSSILPLLASSLTPSHPFSVNPLDGMALLQQRLAVQQQMLSLAMNVLPGFLGAAGLDPALLAPASAPPLIPSSAPNSAGSLVKSEVDSQGRTQSPVSVIDAAFEGLRNAPRTSDAFSNVSHTSDGFRNDGPLRNVGATPDKLTNDFGNPDQTLTGQVNAAVIQNPSPIFNAGFGNSDRSLDREGSRNSLNSSNMTCNPVKKELPMKTEHDTSNVTCCLCCAPFPRDSDDYVTHLRSHLTSSSSHCPSCRLAFHTPSQAEEHFLRLHGNAEKRSCDSCPRRFWLRQSLQKHRESHIITID